MVGVKGGLYLAIKEPNFFFFLLRIILSALVFCLVQFGFCFAGGSSSCAPWAGRWRAGKRTGGTLLPSTVRRAPTHCSPMQKKLVAT